MPLMATDRSPSTTEETESYAPAGGRTDCWDENGDVALNECPVGDVEMRDCGKAVAE